ncbi:MAG: Ig-like domain-containing protein [Bacilli bacterium]|nr:Ig-like domain-containing protein [Bacilli bacterium]
MDTFKKMDKKIFLIVIPVLLMVVGFAIRSYKSSNDDPKIRTRAYNMSLAESVNLDTIYSDKDIVWETNSDKVEIKNNIVTARKSGVVHIRGKKGNIVIIDVEINVLADDDELQLEDHSIETVVGKVDKVEIKEDSVKKVTEEKKFNSTGQNIVKQVVKTDKIVNPDKTITYDSSDEEIVKVDDEGVITPVSPGVAVITVTDSEGNVDYTYITVTEVEPRISTNSYTLKIGDTAKVEYDLSDTDYKENDISWTIDDEGVVVFENGLIKAVGAGNTIVNMHIGDLVYKIRVEVIRSIVLPDTLVLSESEIELKVGLSKKINASITPNNVENGEISWTSSNEFVATVDDGTIVGRSVGSAIITAATVNGLTATVEVVVIPNEIAVEDINFVDNNVTMNVSEKRMFEYVITPQSATNKDVTYVFDDEYLSLDENGYFEALKAGNTILTVMTSNNMTDNINISIMEPIIHAIGIDIEQDDFSMTKGSVANLSVAFNPNNTTDKEINWDSSDETVITIDSFGKVTAVGVGEAVITATSKSGLRSTITITVIEEDIKISSISLNHTALNLKNGETERLVANVMPMNASNKNVSYRSSNPAIATVDDTGLVTGVAKGMAIITVTANDGSNISSNCTVNVTYDTHLSLNIINKTIYVEDTYTITANVTPMGANQGVTWSSNKTSVATVTSAGKVTGVGAGTATITATSLEDNSVVATSTVVVKSGAQKILDKAEDYYLSIEADGDWVHKNDLDDYPDIDQTHYTTCCYLVSTILKRAGFLKSGTLCHLNDASSTTPSGSGNLYSDKVTITAKKSISDLIAGDVIVYQAGNSSGNIAIYSHASNDKLYVYGASSTAEIRKANHPSTHMSSYWIDKSGKLIIVRAKK